MVHFVVLGVSFFQQMSGTRTTEMAEKALRSQAYAYEQQKKARGSRQRLEFEKSFNAVAAAVDAFTQAYNSGGGNTWPRKEAENLADAINALEKTSEWRSLRKAANSKQAP